MFVCWQSNNCWREHLDCKQAGCCPASAHSDQPHRSYSKEAHREPSFPFCRRKKTIHSPSMPKSPSECEQNSGKAPKPNKICPHQIQLYHCSICEKVLAASKNVHKQFINSSGCEKWCSMETRSWGVIKSAGTSGNDKKLPHLKLTYTWHTLVDPHLMENSQNWVTMHCLLKRVSCCQTK